MSDHIQAALREVHRSNAARWAQLVLKQAVMDGTPVGIGKAAPKVFEADSVASLWAWASQRLPVAIAPHVAGKQPARRCNGVAQVTCAVRAAFDAHGSNGAVVKAADGTWGLLSTTKGYGEVAAVVPSRGPSAAPVAFVSHSPSELDAARGEPLTGPYGKVFAEHYLKPLGLSKSQVMLTHLLPVHTSDPVEQVPYRDWVESELSAMGPRVVVALGKEAKQHLGSLAALALPHPSAVAARGGDWGEVQRKLSRLKKRLDTMLTLTDQVHVAKSDLEQQVVYGVTLDPYQFDTQDDWVPPWEIRQTAWNWLASSRVIGFQHQGPCDATVVESFMWPYPTPEDERKAMANEPHCAYEWPFGSDLVHSGAWVLGTRINDPIIWEKIKTGELTGYSIGGTGVRVDVDPMTAIPDVTFIKPQLL